MRAALGRPGCQRRRGLLPCLLLWASISLHVLPGLPINFGVAQADERPNVLFLFADDQRADTIGFLGNDLIETPNIDRLYERGTHFTQAYCMGSIHGAVCVPSRAMLMSGKSMYRTHMQLKDQITFPRVFGQAGYTTFGTGKWHNGQASFAASFEKGKHIMFGGMCNHFEVPIWDMKQDRSFADKRTSDEFSSTCFADATIDFLTNHSSQEPFLCYVAFTAPHDPRSPPAPFDTMYDDRLPPLPANYMGQHPFNTGQMTVRDELLGAWPRTKSLVRQQTAEYYGLISHMDSEIGRILKVLDDRGLMDNTIIIYAADHGLAMGSHGLLGKQSLYEHCMKAPVCIAGPGIPQGQSREQFVYLFDLFPTLCDYSGIDIPENVEGISLLPAIEDAKSETRSLVFTTYADLIRSVRDERWKLVRWPRVDRVQLFDLQTDPNELQDLSAQPEHQPRVLRMMMHLADLQKSYDDPHPLVSDKLLPDQIDLSNFHRKPDRWQPKVVTDKYFDVEQDD